MAEREYGPEIIDRIIDGLEHGSSLVTICGAADMPSRQTVYRWVEGDNELAVRLRDARELGYLFRAEAAVEAAKNAEDPLKGRLAFDAERWMLGRLSVAFRDKPIALGVQVNVGADDALAAISGVLDQAAAAIASSGHSTHTVALESAPRPSDPARQLADMAGAGRARVGQDKDGS